MRPLRRDGVFLALAAAAVAASAHVAGTQTLPYWKPWVMLDEGYRLYPSLRLLHGEPLFGGMFTPYPPLSYQLHRAAFELFGVGLASVRVVLALSQIATTLLTYAVARRFMDRWSSLVAAALSLVWGVVQLQLGYSGWYVLAPTLACVLFLCRWIERGTARPLLVAGLCAGLALAAKHRDGAVLVLAGGVAILLVRIARDFEPRTRLRSRPAGFPLLYAAHLLLPAASLFLVRDHLDVRGALLFVAPGAALCATVLAEQLLGSERVRAGSGRLIRELAAFAAGAAAVNLPWIAYYGAARGGEVWRQLVSIPLGMRPHLVEWLAPDLSGGYALAGAGLLLAGAVLFGADARRARALPALAAAAALALPLLAGLRPSALLAGRFVLLPAATALCILYLVRHRRARGPTLQGLLVLAVVNSAAGLTLHPFTDVNHWLWASTTAFVLACFGAFRLRAYLARRHRVLGLAVVAAEVALLLLMLPAPLRPWAERRPTVALRDAARADVPFDPRSAALIQPVVDFIERHVEPGGYVLEIPSPFFAFLTGRRQAARLDYFYALDAALWDERRELEHLRETDPDFAIVPAERDAWPAWRGHFPLLSGYVDVAYRPAKRVGPVAILRRKRAP